VCAPSTGALADGHPEYALHPPEVSDLGPHVSQVCLCHRPNLGARALAFVREPEQRADLADGESERAGTADEVEPFEVFGPV
jgi:hypothetical protein